MSQQQLAADRFKRLLEGLTDNQKKILKRYAHPYGLRTPAQMMDNFLLYNGDV